MSVSLTVIGIALIPFLIFCHVKIYKLNCAIEALHKKEIADLESKLLLSGNTQTSELGKSKVGVSNKTEQLSSLKKAQQALDERIIQLEVECEVEQIVSEESNSLIKSP